MPEPSPLDIRAVGAAHGARLEQTFACPAVRILPCRISSAYPAVRVLLCQTFVPNVRHVVPARHDAYVLWVRTLDTSEGLRPSVNMQYDLSEVLLDAQGVLM